MGAVPTSRPRSRGILGALGTPSVAMSRIYLSPPGRRAGGEARLVDALRSGWIAPLGPEVDGFERDMCDFVGRRHAAALSSGTAALHLALVSWGVGPGDVIPTST